MLSVLVASMIASFVVCSDPDVSDLPLRETPEPCQAAALPEHTGPMPMDLLDEPSMREQFRRLLREAGYGFHAERAAFVVRNANGSLALVDWPEGGERNGASWEGQFPRGTIAIVHTHPCWLPMPSTVDRATSRRNHLPVYVLTLLRITKTTGADPVVIASGDWSEKPPAETLSGGSTYGKAAW
jgi:hypothetical protein